MLNAVQGDSFNDRAYGCIIGAFVGDACGSYNEFNPERVWHYDRLMEKCMKMNGGGPWRLNAGQVTDDSELAMCLMWGILNSNEDYNPSTYQRFVLKPDLIAE